MVKATMRANLCRTESRENILCRDIIKKRFEIKFLEKKGEKIELEIPGREFEILEKKLVIARKNIEYFQRELRA